MRCWVNGQEVAPEALGRREMNFRQPFPGKASPLSYGIMVSKQELCRYLNNLYEQAVHEEKEDAPHYQAGEWPLLDRLQELGYPSFPHLLEQAPAVVAGIISEWLDQETLDLLVPGQEKEPPHFLLNSIDRVTVTNGDVCIEGQAFPHPLGKAAADNAPLTAGESL